jgi:hypothetical protein
MKGGILAILFMASALAGAQSLDAPFNLDRPVEVVRNAAGRLYLRACVLGPPPPRRCPPPSPSVCIEYCDDDPSPITPRAWCAALAALPVPPGKPGQEISIYAHYRSGAGWVCP